MASNPSAAIHDDLCRAAQYKAIRRFVGRGRDISFKELARDARMDVGRLHDLAQKPDAPEWRPISGGELKAIARALGDDGAEFLSIYHADDGIGAFLLPDPENDRPLNEIAPDAAHDAARLTTAAMTGGNVHDIRSIAHRSIARGHTLLAKTNRGQFELFERKAS